MDYIEDLLSESQKVSPHIGGSHENYGINTFIESAQKSASDNLRANTAKNASNLFTPSIMGAAGEVPAQQPSQPTPQTRPTRPKTPRAIRKPPATQTPEQVEPIAPPRAKTPRSRRNTGQFATVEPPQPPQPQRFKFVYFIIKKNARTSVIPTKIGYTNNVADARVKLEEGNPQDLKAEQILLCEKFDAKEVAEAICAQNAAKCKTRGWYDLSREDINTIVTQAAARGITTTTEGRAKITIAEGKKLATEGIVLG